MEIKQLSNSKQRKDTFSYVSLFSGAGVGCYGLSMAGFRCVATVEKNEKRLAIQKANKKCELPSGYICDDLNDWEAKQKVLNEVKKWNDSGMKGLDVLLATPPCQGMSVCNHKKSNEENRNSLVVSAIQLTQILKPIIFIFENTSLFLKTLCSNSDGELVTIQDAIDYTLGPDYHIWKQKLNLKNYGGYSSRTRTCCNRNLD